jgi:hypothetical protein
LHILLVKYIFKKGHVNIWSCKNNVLRMRVCKFEIQMGVFYSLAARERSTTLKGLFSHNIHEKNEIYSSETSMFYLQEVPDKDKTLV